MRINLIFTISLLAILQVSANSFGQRININEKNTSLSTVLKTIRSQSGYDVLFDAKLVQKATNIDVYLKDATIEEALDKCLTGLNLTYKLEEQTVIIKEKTLIDKIVDHVAHQLAVNEIKGYVFVSKGKEPLGGASITIKRTKKSVYSDNKGIFYLKDVLPTDSLVVSYIGYNTQTVPVNGKSNLYITLEEAVNALDVMVVQGYGKTTQRLATGNIARVSATEIGKQLIDNPILALQGAVAGLEITSVSGQAFANQRIELRGRKSINGNISSEPLIVLDGVPQTVLNEIPNGTGGGPQSAISSGLLVNGTTNNNSFSPLYNINPSDIESVEVLKDADATAIYGSRAGNGVILITTKKGKVGKTDFSARINQGIRSVINNWDLLKTDQYLEMRREVFRNDNITPTASNAIELMVYDQNRYTDWQELGYGGTGKWSDFDASISGGDAQTRFRIASTLHNTTDISSYSGVNQRFSSRMGLTHTTLNKKLKFDVNAGYSATKNTMVTYRSIHLTPPNAPAVFNEKGALNFAEWKTDMFDFNGLVQPTEMKGSALNVSTNLTYTPITNLDFNLRMGYNENSLNSRLQVPLASINTALTTTPNPRILLGTTKLANILVEPEMNYNVILGRGRLSLLVGASYQDNNTRRQSLQASGFTSDQQMGSINAATKFNAIEAIQLYKYAGVFARINYNWQNKYILNLNARRDGSSRFGVDYRFGNFGAIGAAWILSEEDFVKSALPKFINFVKLRGSAGIVGADGIGDYKYLSQWGVLQNGERLPTYDNVAPVVPQIQPNSEFRWQRNLKYEGGINLAFFKETIGLDVSYYSEFTNNQLLSFPTPVYTGFSSLILNSPAEVKNSGIEIGLTAALINRKNFGWNASLNFGRNRNVLVNYRDFENSPYYSIYKIGQSLSNIYVLQGKGVNPQTGEYEYLDADGVGGVQLKYGVPAGTEGDDRVVAINTSPDFSGGMNHSFRYKNFGLSANFFYTKKKAMYIPRSSANANMTVDDYRNFWKQPGDKALYSKLTSLNKQSNVNYTASTMAYIDIDYIRLNNLQFSYSLPNDKLKSLGIGNLSINATAQNIFVLSKFKGQDPEIMSNGSLPQSRTITMGLNCTF